MTENDSLLGTEVRDEISGFTGIVTTIGDHLTGCTRIGVRASGEEQTDRRSNEEYFFEDQLDVLDDDTKWRDYGKQAITNSEFALGEQVKDNVTGIEGIIVVLNFSLFNCPSAAVQTETGGDSNIEWFDMPRLEKTGAGVRTEFTSLSESENTEETGPVVDSRTGRDHLTADRL